MEFLLRTSFVRIHMHRPCHWLSFDIPPGFCLENLFCLILRMVKKTFDRKWRRAFLCRKLANDIDATRKNLILLQNFKCFSTILPLVLQDSSQNLFTDPNLHFHDVENKCSEINEKCRIFYYIVGEYVMPKCHLLGQ